ncbi:MAG: hypothetical protein RLZZ524_633 [Pseudomonadota bacterium]
MTQINEAFEARVAAHRNATRQDQRVPFLIRDDGVLFPNVPLIAKKQNFRPYRGDINAPLEKRLEFLRGVSGRRVINTEVVADDEAPFDNAKAPKDDLIKFAADEFGEIIDPADHLNKIRSQVAKLAGVDAATVFGGKRSAEAQPQA